MAAHSGCAEEGGEVSTVEEIIKGAGPGPWEEDGDHHAAGFFTPDKDFFYCEFSSCPQEFEEMGQDKDRARRVSLYCATFDPEHVGLMENVVYWAGIHQGLVDEFEEHPEKTSIVILEDAWNNLRAWQKELVEYRKEHNL
jgi:hypothetical protein